MKFKKIGIMGGMGPESTALLYRYIVRCCQLKFNSFRDEDFPEIIIYNLPIPDITKSATGERDVKKELRKAVLLFEAANVNFIAFPCNTLSYFVDYLKKQSKIPIIDIVEETANYIKSLNIDKIALFSTETTIKKEIYEKYLGNIEICKPNNQKRITNIIYKVMKGKGTSPELNILMSEYTKQKKFIVLGCTDLSVVAENIKSRYIIDSLKVLANSIVEKARI